MSLRELHNGSEISWEYTLDFGVINVNLWTARNIDRLSVIFKDFSIASVTNIKIFSYGEYPYLGDYRYYYFPPLFEFIEVSSNKIDFILTCYSPAVSGGDSIFYVGSSARFVYLPKCCNLENGFSKILGVLNGG